MSNSRYAWVVCVLALLASDVALCAQPVPVRPSDPHVQYVGRFTQDHMFGWTGSTIRVRFVGTSIGASFATAGNKVAMQVVIDGKPTDVFYLTKDKKQYPIARDLPEGEHTVELFQRTEAYLGQTQFLGFTLSDGAQLRTIPAASRRILSLGDSITCAYGSEATDRKQGNTPENENGYMSYAAITARALDADVHMICWSGKGLYRDRSMQNDRTATIPKLLGRTLPLRNADDWPMSRFVPDVVTINLGTNDLAHYDGKKPQLQKDDYLGAYRELIKRLHAAYPKAQIFACIGPMAFDPITEWLPDLADEYPYVHYVMFARYAGDSEIGGHWHPATPKQQKMAEHLTGEIRKVMRW